MLKKCAERNGAASSEIVSFWPSHGSCSGHSNQKQDGNYFGEGRTAQPFIWFPRRHFCEPRTAVSERSIQPQQIAHRQSACFYGELRATHNLALPSVRCCDCHERIFVLRKLCIVLARPGGTPIVRSLLPDGFAGAVRRCGCLPVAVHRRWRVSPVTGALSDTGLGQ